MLTDAGMDLITVMEVMCAWGTKYLGVTPTLPRIPPGLRRRPRRRS